MLANSSAMKSGPSISGDLVVWTEYVFRESDVPDADTYLFDLVTGEKMIVCSSGSRSMSDDLISGDCIVWSKGCSVMLFIYEHTREPASTTKVPAPVAAVLAALALVSMARRRG
ncbi:hypothetical protein J2129_000961 [Methanofollis sp. W23]|uniref:hypothetical protein n=1 Tax=Methanofollis sp. W23 TaxID=2817849 RepID=UPI001AEB5AE4|nr:hypothetical protein [Methanofollis sp. W23]MBP2145507.1 hypothetical protein [Methanofollis sp. W23]